MPYVDLSKIHKRSRRRFRSRYSFKKNLAQLLEYMKNEQNCQIWTLAKDKAEYERFVTLLSNDKSRNTIDQEVFNKLLRERCSDKIRGEVSATVIHDPCSIRKSHSLKMEKLDRVQDLDGNTINGYRTFNSVLLEGSKISLLGCRPYSQKENSADDEDKHLTNKEVSFKEIRLISKALKSDFPERCITHLFDREADDAAYFKLIDEELEDLFIFRLKTNRNSDVEYWDEKKGKERKVKLHLKPFSNEFKYIFQKLIHKGKCHQQVRAQISYEKKWVGEGYYNIVRVKLFGRNGKALFAKPMVLITNYEILNEEIALLIFQKYLKRSKIEGLFKFLKNSLGWEHFQIRNFQAIKNILLLGFFVGAYFCEREPELIENPLVIIICELAKSKGKITKHFFMKGLVVLAHFQLAQQFFKEHNFSQDDIDLLMTSLE